MMIHHTQTSAPNAAPATSVSPLEQSGSTKTKFPEVKTVRIAIAKLIYDIENNRCHRLAYRDAVEGLCQDVANQITRRMHFRDTGMTLRDLRELAKETLETIIVTESEEGQTRQNYGGHSASDVIKILKRLHRQGIKVA